MLDTFLQSHVLMLSHLVVLTGHAHRYAANASMVDTAFQNSDGDFLIVPQLGSVAQAGSQAHRRMRIT